MSKKITQDEFEIRIKEKYPNEQFEIIEYISSSKPLQVRCTSCGKILSYPQAKNFLAANKRAGCSECAGLKAKNSVNLQKIQVQYDILESYRDSNSKMWYTCKCKRCGRISTHSLVSFLENKCRCEGPGNHYTEQEFKDRLAQEYGAEYTLLVPFTNVNTKALFKHSCGFAWSVTPAHILYNKSGCPKCQRKDSKACYVIQKELDSLGISYERERYLENSLQRFDFYIELNGQQYAIEYNGEQHYKYNPFFHGHDISVFEKYQERDLRKKQYCFDHNIQLIVLPYTLTHEEIRAHINELFSSSTTSPSDVASSEAK